MADPLRNVDVASRQARRGYSNGPREHRRSRYAATMRAWVSPTVAVAGAPAAAGTVTPLVVGDGAEAALRRDLDTHAGDTVGPDRVRPIANPLVGWTL